MIEFGLVLIGLSTIWIFMFKIELLNESGIAFWTFVLYTLLLFAFSFVFSDNIYFNSRIIPVLKMPLISVVVYRGLRFVFFKVYNRNPENTFWVFEKKPVQDIIFTILFWFLGAGLPFILISLLM
jgi:hypothetical protein